MSPALIAAFLWLAVANVVAMLPSRHHHWPAAYVLMIIGAPLLVWLWRDTGWLAAILFVVCAASVLRWPVIRAARRVRAAFR